MFVSDRSVFDGDEVRVRQRPIRIRPPRSPCSSALDPCSVITKPMLVGGRSRFDPDEARVRRTTGPSSITTKPVFVGNRSVFDHDEARVRRRRNEVGRERNGSRCSAKPGSSGSKVLCHPSNMGVLVIERSGGAPRNEPSSRRTWLPRRRSGVGRQPNPIESPATMGRSRTNLGWCASNQIGPRCRWERTNRSHVTVTVVSTTSGVRPAPHGSP
jgi:hypothetical protein